MKLNEAYYLSEEIIIESSVARTKSYLQNYDCATISAFRPKPGMNRKDALAENKKNSSELGKLLNNLGYTHFLVDGAWVKQNEDGTVKKNSKGKTVFGSEITYFVVNNNGDSREKFRAELKKLGERFDQDSVMFYAKGTNLAFWSGTTHRNDSDLKFGEKRLLKNGAWNPQDFRTTLRGRKNTGYSYDWTPITK